MSTPHGLYQLHAPAEEYAPLFRLPGATKAHPLGEEGLSAPSLLGVYERKEEHPFTSKKGFVIPALHLSEFEFCDAQGAPRSLFRALPDGTLRAAEKEAKKALSGDALRATLDRLQVYVRARMLPAGGAAAARPWVRCGPVRAWSVDFDRKGADGRAAPGLWVCCKSVALYMSAAHVATDVEAHARSWFANDGLLVHSAATLLSTCREHRDPRNAVKLFNNITSTAWGRMPAEITGGKAGAKKEAIYEKHVTAFLVETLVDNGFKLFADRLQEQRKRFLEEEKRKPDPSARAPAKPVPPASARRVAVPATVSAPEPPPPPPSATATSSSAATSGSGGGVGGGGSAGRARWRPAPAPAQSGPPPPAAARRRPRPSR